MSDCNERHIEQAQAFDAEQRDRMVHRVRSALRGEGSEECEDCGRHIGARRRAAMPSARRCIACQTKFESGASR